MSLSNLAQSICGAETIEDVINNIGYDDAGNLEVDPSHCNRLVINLNRTQTLDLLVPLQFVELVEQLRELAKLDITNVINLSVDLDDVIAKANELSEAVNQRRVVGYVPISRYVQEGSGIAGEYGGSLGEPQQIGGFSYCQQYVLLLWSDGTVTELDGATVVDLNAIQDMVGYCHTLEATPENTEHLYVLADAYRDPNAPAPVIKPF